MKIISLTKSDRRDSNPRPPPWQGGVLPTVLLSHNNYLQRLFRATDGTRTRDLHLGKVAYYQLYYYRTSSIFYVFVFIRTIFSISQLSHYVNIFFKFFEFFFLSENSNNLINARNNLYLTVPGILFFTYSASSFFSSFATTAIPSSSSCFASTCPGASVIRSDASFTFGNAITSRMLSCFAISITRRSRP